jgi:hypothetical protein
MKDVEPRVLLSERPIEEALTDEDFQQALALGTGDLLRTSLNVYTTQLSSELDLIQITEDGEELLHQLLDKPNSGFANRSSFKRTLLRPLARDIMFMIWRESKFISEKALVEAGLGRQVQDFCKHLTRNSLKNTICDGCEYMSASGGDALKRSIDRTCDALEVYGLVERTKIRDNLKPINGTRRLHALMTSVHMAVSHIFSRQLQLEEGARNG